MFPCSVSMTEHRLSCWACLPWAECTCLLEVNPGLSCRAVSGALLGHDGAGPGLGLGPLALEGFFITSASWEAQCYLQ